MNSFLVINYDISVKLWHCWDSVSDNSLLSKSGFMQQTDTLSNTL